MNGKNRRTKSCWSRGYGHYSNTQILKNDNTITLPNFKKTFYNNLSNEQKSLFNFFSNYPVINKVEQFSYNSNTPYHIVELRNSDFMKGTVRIRKPGIYRLTSNVIFNPNPDNDFMPLTEDIEIGLYPQHMMGPYHLGFFAAITVECDDVIIDLNGFSIKQSKEHNFQQRFYANIELANAPFITSKGPGNFQGSLEFKAANKVLVYNGKLTTSSHHGIHANTANNVMLYNIYFTDFEVAAIALNGTDIGILSEIYVQNNKTKIPVLSTYSQARFIRPFIDNVVTSEPELTLGDLSATEIHEKLNTELRDTFEAFKNGNDIPIDYFKNENNEYDGNIYGIVLNVNGPVIGPFLTEKTEQNIGNNNIFLEEIHINNLSSHPVEIIGIKNPNGNNGAYGGKMQAGPIGDIFQITNNFVTENGIYKGTSLSNAQLLIAKSNLQHKGTTSITPETVSWADLKKNITEIIGENMCYYVGSGDSMGHTMKGNIGLFISGGSNIKGKNINIHNIFNKGANVGTELVTPIQPENRSFLGSSAVNILLTASNKITINNANLGMPISENKFGDHELIVDRVKILNTVGGTIIHNSEKYSINII